MDTTIASPVTLPETTVYARKSTPRALVLTHPLFLGCFLQSGASQGSTEGATISILPIGPYLLICFFTPCDRRCLIFLLNRKAKLQTCTIYRSFGYSVRSGHCNKARAGWLTVLARAKRATRFNSRISSARAKKAIINKLSMHGTYISGGGSTDNNKYFYYY